MKLQIAAAQGATFLVLDEPTSGGPLSRDEQPGYHGDFMKHRTVLFSSLSQYRARRGLCLIDKGQIVTCAEGSELLGSYRILHGGRTPLDPDVAAEAYGLRSHAAGWDALIATRLIGEIPDDAVAEEPTLDDIVVRIAKGH